MHRATFLRVLLYHQGKLFKSLDEKICLLFGIGFVPLLPLYQRSETCIRGDKYTKVCKFFE